MKTYRFKKQLRILRIICLFYCINFSVFADQEHVLKPIGISAASLTDDFFYPPYFRQVNALTSRNIRREMSIRMRHIYGHGMAPRFFLCFRLQNRLKKIIEKFPKSEHEEKLYILNHALVLKRNSPLFEATPRLPTVKCRYRYIRDFSNNGDIYCAYHGVAFNSEIYQKYKNRFEGSRPIVTAFNIVDLLLLLPSLILLPFSCFVIKKLLSKK